MHDPDETVEPSTYGTESQVVPIGELVARARERHGIAAAALAGAMLGLQDVIEPRRRETPPIVVEASGEPGDIDRDGITVDTGDGTFVHAPPPLERSGPSTQA